MRSKKIAITASLLLLPALLWISCAHSKQPAPVSFAELSTWLDRDDVCSLATSDLEHRAASSDVFKLISHGSDLGAHPEESSQSFHAYLGELANGAHLRYRSEFGKDSRRSLAIGFYTALAYAGELANVALPPESESASLALFTRLMEADPGNGAYPLFRALIRHDLGQSSALVRKDLILAAEAPRFQMYFENDCLRTIEEGSRDEAHLYLALDAVSHRLPVPLLDGFNFIEEFFEKKDPALEAALRKLSSKIRKSALARLEKHKLLYCEVADLMISGILFDHLDPSSRQLASLSQTQTDDIRHLQAQDSLAALIGSGCEKEKLTSAAEQIRRRLGGR